MLVSTKHQDESAIGLPMANPLEEANTILLNNYSPLKISSFFKKQSYINDQPLHRCLPFITPHRKPGRNFKSRISLTC